MLKIIGIIAIVIAVPIVVVLGYAATKPDTFQVKRSAEIEAPPEKIFPLITDFRQWEAWSPYETKDPEMKRTFSGPLQGKGAVYEWDGNKNVGTGRITITDVATPSKVTLTLDMIRPFTVHNIVEFTLQEKGETTNVTWVMHGRTPYIAKIMHVFFDMDTMVGKDFESGLAKLKVLAEA